MAYEKFGREGRPEGKIKVIKILDALNRHGARYIVIGGWAVILHGFTRMTMDLDIMVEPSRENLTRILDALREFSKDKSLEELPQIDLTQYGVVRVMPEDFGVVIDLVWKIGNIDYQKAVQDAEEAEIDGVKIKIAGLDTLIKMKNTVRPKDQMDLLFLKGKKEFLEKQGEL